MMNRTTRRASGLVLQEAGRGMIDWTYDSATLGRIQGELEYSGGFDGGWTITGLPKVGSVSVTFWVIPVPLMEAVERIEERIQTAESEAIRLNSEEVRLEAELNELFDQ